MVDTVRIPVEDGGWIEVPADDPRALAYQLEWNFDLRTLKFRPPKAVAAQPRQPRETKNGIYTVQSGDTLSAIAKDLLGDDKMWPKIAELNHLRNPNLILVGQHLIIPNQEAKKGGKGAAPDQGMSGPFSVGPAFGDPYGEKPLGKWPGLSMSSDEDSVANLALARGFMFVFFEQLPAVGVSSSIIRKVAVVPRNYAFPFQRPMPVPGVGPIWPRDPKGAISAVEHVMNTKPLQSPFLSASDRAFASGSIDGTPLLIDVAKVKAAGGQVMTVEQLVAELSAYATKNPASRQQIDKLIWTVSKIEGEVLIRGGVPSGAATRVTGSAHLGSIQSAEGLWADFKAGDISKAELEQGLVDLERGYAKARVVGRVGRVLTVVGIVMTAYDLGMAADRSYEQHSVKPLGAEVIRQVGGWGGAAAGAKIGAVVGAAFGIETGPGAIITGAVGAIVFGAAGYFGADLLADQISPN